MPIEFDWSLPPLDPYDERLINAYQRVRRAVDNLPYTQEFEKLCALAEIAPTDESRHNAFRRLLTLRKMGRLPGLALSTD